MRKKLFVFFMIILIFGVTMTGFIAYSISTELVIDTSINGLKSEAIFVEDKIDANRSVNLDLLAHEIRKKANIRVTFINTKGVVIGESDVSTGEMENHLQRPEVQQALKNNQGSSVRLSKTENINLCYFAKKIKVNGENIILRLAIPLNSMRDVQNRYLYLILISMFIGIIISALLVFLYLDIFTRPIKSFINLATTIATGHYEKRIYITSDDEIGQLGQAFNLMAERLQETIEDLYDKKNKLVSIITSMDDGVIVVDNNERIILTNPSACNYFTIGENVEGKFLLEEIRNNKLENIIMNHIEEPVEIDISFPKERKLRIKSTKVINSDKQN